jgi:inner membrane protein
MSKTHIAVGIAASLAITAPASAPAIACAVTGGALGGVLPDVDTLRHDVRHDARNGQVITVAILVASIIADIIWGWGIWSDIYAASPQAIAGLVIFVIAWVASFFSAHRSFSHSILGLGVFALSVWLAAPMLLGSFAIGFASHLLLDVLNKKPVQLLFPVGRGVCLVWCYANRTANTVLLILGLVYIVVFFTLYFS